LEGVSGRSLTRDRAGAGVLRHLVLVVQIFLVRDSVVWGYGDLGVLLGLEAKFLQRKRVNIRSQYDIGKSRYISVLAEKIYQNSRRCVG
jgi:hypothetical protein